MSLILQAVSDAKSRTGINRRNLSNAEVDGRTDRKETEELRPSDGLLFLLQLQARALVAGANPG